MHRRYGEIRLSDCASSMTLILLLLGIGLFSWAMKLFVEGMVFLIVAIFSLLNIYFPQLEYFSISGNVITTQNVFRSCNIIIPRKSVVVITQADISPVIGRQSFLLKNRLAISILQDMTLEDTLNLLHGKYPSQFTYTNSTIKKTFDDYLFVYNFVSFEGLIEKVLQATECFIIIPKSIQSRLPIINDPSINVYIDPGY